MCPVSTGPNLPDETRDPELLVAEERRHVEPVAFALLLAPRGNRDGRLDAPAAAATLRKLQARTWPDRFGNVPQQVQGLEEQIRRRSGT